MLKQILAEKLFNKYTTYYYLGETAKVELDDFEYEGEMIYCIAEMYIDPVQRYASVLDLSIKTGNEFDYDYPIDFRNADLAKAISKLINFNQTTIRRSFKLHNISL